MNSGEVRLGEEQLPCGRQLDDLIEQVADRRPSKDASHQRRCPHCRAAVSELAQLWTPLHELADQQVSAPRTLTMTVMERVAAIAANGWHAIVRADQGVTRIAAWVVAITARRAALAVPGVLTVSGVTAPPLGGLDESGAVFRRSQPSPIQRQTAAGVGVAGRHIVVDLEVTADDRSPLPALGHAVRRSVGQVVPALTGLEVVEANVEFTDIEVALEEGR